MGLQGGEPFPHIVHSCMYFVLVLLTWAIAARAGLRSGVGLDGVHGAI